MKSYDVEELTDEEVEETIGGGLAELEEFTSASTPIVTNRNFKYTTTEDEICLTDLTQRLGKIDKIQVINNQINAKILCNDNLISVENQGVYGLIQIEVLGHNAGETKFARAENIFVEFDSDEEEWIAAEDDYEDDTYYDELDAEELEETGGKSRGNVVWHRKSVTTTANSCKIHFPPCGHIEDWGPMDPGIKVTFSKTGSWVKVSKKPGWKNRAFSASGKLSGETVGRNKSKRVKHEYRFTVRFK